MLNFKISSLHSSAAVSHTFLTSTISRSCCSLQLRPRAADFVRACVRVSMGEAVRGQLTLYIWSFFFLFMYLFYKETNSASNICEWIDLVIYFIHNTLHRHSSSLGPTFNKLYMYIHLFLPQLQETTGEVCWVACLTFWKCHSSFRPSIALPNAQWNIRRKKFLP